MRVIGPDGEKEVYRFPGWSAFRLALTLLKHPTYTIIMCENLDWYTNIEVEVDKKMKVLRIQEKTDGS